MPTPAAAAAGASSWLDLAAADPQAEDHGPEIPEYLQGRIPLFRRALVETLRTAGVDNLETHDAVLVDPDTGTRHETHLAVNIVGLLAAADMERRGDASRAGGALLRRLAESTQAILVHERLREVLLAAGFRHLAFYDPKDVAL